MHSHDIKESFRNLHTQVPQAYEDMYADITDTRRRTYLGMVTQVDDAVGYVMQALEDKGIKNNTLIIWMSDVSPS